MNTGPPPGLVIHLRPIGIVHSPYATPLDAPRQGMFARKESVIEVAGEFADGLAGIEALDELLVLWWADRADRSLLVREDKGVFAGRAPHRPNPIALTAVKLVAREGNCLRVMGLDAADGTPVIDIKSAHPEWEGWSSLPDVNALREFG